MASEPLGLEIRDFPSAVAAEDLFPAHIPAAERPFHEALAAGSLALQHCTECGRPRFPVAPVCPYCLSSELEWRPVPPAGIVHSWVRYRRSFLPEFESAVPYSVLTVALAPDLFVFGRLAEPAPEPFIGMPVRAIAERWADGRHVLAFVAEEGKR